MTERKNSEKRIASNNKWTNAHYDRINLAIPKGHKAVIKAHAEIRGESVNGFVSRAISETLERDGSPEAAQRPVTPRTGGDSFLTPETLKTAQRAAEDAGEAVPAFIGRAVDTQAARDEMVRKMATQTKKKTEQ